MGLGEFEGGEVVGEGVVGGVFEVWKGEGGLVVEVEEGKGGERYRRGSRLLFFAMTLRASLLCIA